MAKSFILFLDDLFIMDYITPSFIIKTSFAITVKELFIIVFIN